MTTGNKIRAIYVLNFASFAAWMPVFNLYFERLGFKGFEVGLIAGVLPVSMFIVQPFLGIIADKYGRLKILQWMLLLSALLLPLFVIKGGLVYYLFLTFILSIFFNSIFPLTDSAALDYIDGDPQASYSRTRMWGSIGWTVCVYPVGWFLVTHNISSIFIIASVIMLAGAFICFTTKNSKKESKDGFEINLSDFKKLLSNKRVFLFLIILFLYGVGTIPVNTFYSIYLDKIGASEDIIGLAFAIQALPEIPFLFIGSKIVNRYGSLPVLIFCLVVTALRMFLLTIITNPVYAVALDATNWITNAMFIVVAVEYMNAITPVKLRATGQSLFWAFYSGAGVFAGNLWAGYWYEKKSIQYAITVDACILALLILLPLLMLRKKIDAPREKEETMAIESV